MNTKKENKGSYSTQKLPVKKGYVSPLSRKKMVWLGFAGAAVMLLYFAVDAFFLENRFVTRGALSSNHANFESDCAACHDIGNAVIDLRCSTCHEKVSPFPSYGFPAHYLYESNDLQRVSPDTTTKYAALTQACAECHLEHRGRDAAITAVADQRCLSCHRFSAFDGKHPEFEFARRSQPDDSSLLMTHNRHTNFVLAFISRVDRLDSTLIRELKEKAGPDSLFFFESACTYCHNPEADGKNFTDISYERHCADCHLNDKALFGLPQLNPRQPNEPGVASLTDLKRRGGPGVAWAFTANPALIPNEDGEVRKAPIFHKDPWIMANLRLIRSKLYPGDGLYELLSSPEAVAQSRVDSLYGQAISTLKNYLEELQFRPELKSEIDRMQALLKTVRNRLKDPFMPRSGEKFALPSAFVGEPLTPEQRAGFEQLVYNLTDINASECQKCHIVENAAIRRVQADQDVLTRSRFDHRAHVLEARCTECHSDILINETTLLMSVDDRSGFGEKYPEIQQSDAAVTQNIPLIASCRECHTAKRVANTCVTCHAFHPRKENRTALQLFGSGK